MATHPSLESPYRQRSPASCSPWGLKQSGMSEQLSTACSIFFFFLLKKLISFFTHIFWRRKWQFTSVFLAGEFHRQWSLAGYSPWGCQEWDTTEQLSNNENPHSSKRFLIYLPVFNLLPSIWFILHKTVKRIF